MARVTALLSLATLVALVGCSSEEIQCNGVLVGNTCCTAICQTAADRPAGWSCQGVQGGNACVKL